MREYHGDSEESWAGKEDEQAARGAFPHGDL